MLLALLASGSRQFGDVVTDLNASRRSERAIMAATREVAGHQARAESYARDFLISGDGTRAEAATEEAARALAAVASLRQLISNQHGQQSRLGRLESLLEEHFARLHQIVAAHRAGSLDAHGRERLEDSGRGSSRREEDYILEEIETRARGLADQDATSARSTFESLDNLALSVSALAFCIVGAALWISEREQRRDAQTIGQLTRHERLLAATLDSMSCGVLATDRENRITHLNPEAERLTGWAEASAIGRPIDEVLRLGEEPPPTGDPRTGVPPPNPPDTPASHRLLVARGGTKIPIASSAAVIREPHEPATGTVFLLRDVTADRQAWQELERLNRHLDRLVAERSAALAEREARFAFLVSASPAIIYTTTPQAPRRTTFISDNTRTKLGYAPERFIRDPDFWINHVHPEDRVHVLAGLSRTETERSRALEYRFLAQDGSWRWMRDETREVKDAGGQPVEIIGYWADITEHKQAEHAANRAQRLQSIGTLAGGIAHDLNNALTPVVVSIELLQAQHPGGDKLVDELRRSAQRASDMVRQLLTFARGAEEERALLSPRHLIHDMEQIIRSTFPKHIELRTHVEPGTGVVLGDATQLHQVILNLCVNARDAMPQGGILTIEAGPAVIDASFARTVPDANSGNYVRIAVGDTGAGMPADVLEHLFDPFFTTKAPNKGTGLGLSTALGIVRSHGGFIRVASTLGVGTTLGVYFPVATEEQPKIAVDQTAPPSYRGRGETILLVDDEKAIRTIMRQVLERMNFTVLTAADGAEGIVRATENREALRIVITDLHMPGMDGLQFARTLRRLVPEVPIIATSGAMDENVSVRLKDVGVTALLQKPYREQQLASALRDILDPVSRPVSAG